MESTQPSYIMKMEAGITAHVKRKSMKTTERFKRLKVKANGLIMYQLSKHRLLEPEWEKVWSSSNFSEMYLKYGIRCTWGFAFITLINRTCKSRNLLRDWTEKWSFGYLRKLK